MSLLIKGARLIDNNLDTVKDLYIKDGKIEKIGSNLDIDVKTIEADGKVLMPGFVDLHVHFRDPGLEGQENLKTGSKAALRGGYTTVNLMANTNPITDTIKQAEDIMKRGADLKLINIYQTLAVTKGFDGKNIDEIKNLNSDKIKFISDDGFGIMSNLTVYKALNICKEKGLILASHAEDMDLTPISYRISENISTFRDLYLSQVTGGRLHLSHVSTKEAIKAIRQAKGENTPVTCEVTPHHIGLYDNDYKVNPPIREKADTLEIIEGIKDGTVDAIATDHAPHRPEDKLKGAPGISAIETAFSSVYTDLVVAGHINFNRLAELLSTNPAEIMGLNKGKIEKGYDADLVLIDLERDRIVKAEEFLSMGKNTLLEGKTLKGEILMTIVDGEIRYEE